MSVECFKIMWKRLIHVHTNLCLKVISRSFHIQLASVIDTFNSTLLNDLNYIYWKTLRLYNIRILFSNIQNVETATYILKLNNN